VKDATAAASVGLREGVSSMHGRHGGGSARGAFELSSACGLPVIVNLESITS